MLVFYVDVLVMLYSIVYGFLEFLFWLNSLVGYWVRIIITRQINVSLIIIIILFSFYFYAPRMTRRAFCLNLYRFDSVLKFFRGRLDIEYIPLVTV